MNQTPDKALILSDREWSLIVYSLRRYEATLRAAEAQKGKPTLGHDGWGIVKTLAEKVMKLRASSPELSTSLSLVPLVLRIACPHCLAPVGKRCVTKESRPGMKPTFADDTHRARTKIAG